MEPADELSGALHGPIPAIHHAIQVEDDQMYAMRRAGSWHGTDDRGHFGLGPSVPRMLFRAPTALYDAAAFGPGSAALLTVPEPRLTRSVRDRRETERDP